MGPCGGPVLSVWVEDLWGPSLTVWGRFVRKCLIQEQVSGIHVTTNHCTAQLLSHTNTPRNTYINTNNVPPTPQYEVSQITQAETTKENTSVSDQEILSL